VARADRDGEIKQQSADVRLALASVDDMSARVHAMTQDLEQRQRDVAVMLDELTSRIQKLESEAAPESAGPRIDASTSDVFNRARIDLDAGRADLAAMGFRSFVEQYPGSPLAADAQFLIGESFYVRDQFEEARAEYQRVIDLYPDSTKRPLAMLRAGNCLANTGRSDQAAAMLRRLIETFPGTTEALAARERLADFQ
jgi:tol-pal system protein YbgF